ncbi:MAG TPA: DAK2 domain-containing protein [Gaiellaceae bacterium]
MTAEGDLELVRGLVGAALASLEASRGRLDDLNVYPVPDGDTGTNLILTVRAVAEAVASAEADRPALAQTVARAALMGARGNSGVILSQIVRGVAEVLARSTNGIDPALTARALRGASDAAYRAVRRPVEGTMLSVIRGLAEEAERHEGEAGPLGDLLVELVRHGEETVARTPEQLDVLREAGVVDAGGAGLVELLRGLAGAVSGDVPPAAPAPAAFANMHEQQEQRERRLSLVPATRAKSGVVAVAAGEGNRLLFETLAEPVGTIRVVAGGQTADPSTAELLAAVEALDADEAIILPNNANVRLAAEQAADEAERPAAIVPTDSIPAGLAAVLVYDGTRGAAENAAEMRGAAAAVAAGEVMRASRDLELNGLAIRQGDWLGLAEGEPVAGGDDFAEVASGVVEQLLGRPRTVLTLLTGAEPPPLDGLVKRLTAAHPELEVEVHEGGQPHFPLLLGAE